MKKIEVAILDKNYSLITDESDVVLDEALSFLQNALQPLVAKNCTVEKAAIIVALQYAVELTKEKYQKEMVSSRVKQLISLCQS